MIEIITTLIVTATLAAGLFYSEGMERARLESLAKPRKDSSEYKRELEFAFASLAVNMAAPSTQMRLHERHSNERERGPCGDLLETKVPGEYSGKCAYGKPCLLSEKTMLEGHYTSCPRRLGGEEALAHLGYSRTIS